MPSPILLAAACLAGAAPPQEAKLVPEPTTPITGKSHASLEPFDQLMASFMTERKVPGGALAVTKNGRLVYARGFGYADVERKEPVQPGSLFRVASLSKPLTGVAILQLVERGKLKLDDKVFDLLQLTPHLEAGASVDPRLKQITVLHLLHHTGGWDREKTFDAMFRSIDIAKALGVPPPARQEHIIRYMTGQPLQFDPGSRYAYSNFGYCLLGRIIERVAGQSYEAYVQANVLAPLGITAMRIGRTLASGRAPGEVTYYQPDGKTAPAVVGEKIGEAVPWPYGAWYLEGFDSHGGWIASAVDMVRFAAELDEPSRRRLLRPESIRTMFARPDGAAGHNPDGSPKDFYYGCGWNVRPVRGKANHWHLGMVNGTAALLVRRHDGINWAVLFNTHCGPDGKFLGAEIDPLVHRAADAVREWPEADLFAK
jgi:N-acyl-D-amino-acid deacylase